MVGIPADVLEEGSSVRFEAHGGSMSPWIRDGDAVTVAPVTSGTAPSLTAGDVLGRVTAVARGSLRTPVPRGTAGLLLVRAGRLALRIRDRLRGAREAAAVRPEA
jgi:hypothetical protein